MSSVRKIRGAGVAANVGGLLWVIASTGHTFTHGSTQSPRNATILGWESLDFFRLLAIPPLLFIVGLVGTQATRAPARRRRGRDKGPAPVRLSRHWHSPGPQSVLGGDTIPATVAPDLRHAVSRSSNGERNFTNPHSR